MSKAILLVPADVEVRGNSVCVRVFRSSTPGLWLALLRTPGQGDAWTVTHHSGYAVAGPRRNVAFGHGDEEAAYRADRLGATGVDWTKPTEEILRLPPNVLARIHEALLG